MEKDDDKVLAVWKAWNNPGPNPTFHERAKAYLRREWAVVANALDQLPRPEQDVLKFRTEPVPTPQQLRILERMCLGETNEEIGEYLSLSANTVKSHSSRLFKRIGARDRSNAVAIAFRNGWIQ